MTTMVDVAVELGKLLETDSDPMRALLGRMLRLVMEAEASALCGAEHGERSEERTAHRNGYRQRVFETRMGTIDLAIPKLRTGSYLPSFLEPRRRWERAFVQVVAEAYVQGVSTRNVDALLQAMGAQGISKSEVSRMAGELDEEVRHFRERPLEKAYPYLWLDALYVKLREGGRVVSKAVLLAYAVGEDGFREVLGVDVADGEMTDAWKRFLEGLVARGLRGVQLVVSDAHAGLQAARVQVLNATSWQRCQVHFLRNVLSRVGKAAQPAVSAVVRGVLNQPDAVAAKDAMRKAKETLGPKFPQVVALLEEAEHDVLTCLDFPAAHWRQIRSTNPLERENKEIRRRADVVGIFPNRDAVVRLVSMLLAEQNDEWAVAQRRYFSLESMKAVLPPGDPSPATLDMEQGLLRAA
jgi:transposase-like protein